MVKKNKSKKTKKIILISAIILVCIIGLVLFSNNNSDLGNDDLEEPQEIIMFDVGWSEITRSPSCSNINFGYVALCRFNIDNGCELRYTEDKQDAQTIVLQDAICTDEQRTIWTNMYLDPEKDYIITLDCGVGLKKSARLYNQFC